MSLVAGFALPTESGSSLASKPPLPVLCPAGAMVSSDLRYRNTPVPTASGGLWKGFAKAVKTSSRQVSVSF